MDRWKIIGLGKRICKKGLEYLIVTEVKRVLKSQVKVCVKGTLEPTVRAPNRQSWDNLSNNINNIVSDCNPKYTINCS